MSTNNHKGTGVSSSGFSEAEVSRLAGYYDMLRRIHTRLAIEGYFLKDGKTWDIFKAATGDVFTFEEEADN